jgi:hypothetical protein
MISAIFSHAKKEQYYACDNPVSLVRPPKIRRKRTCSLTLAQAKEALGVMRYPERELTLLAVFTDMNMTEILGLQWNQVNLAQVECNHDGNRIAPRTIAVRSQLYRGQLESVKKSHVRNLPIPIPLLHMLLKLRGRAKFTGPDDFVLVSHVGTPVNQNNIMARRLRPIARCTGVPSLSLQAYRSIRKILAGEVGQNSQKVFAREASSIPLEGCGIQPMWHYPPQQEHIQSMRETALASDC